MWPWIMFSSSREDNSRRRCSFEKQSREHGLDADERIIFLSEEDTTSLSVNVLGENYPPWIKKLSSTHGIPAARPSTCRPRRTSAASCRRARSRRRTRSSPPRPGRRRPPRTRPCRWKAARGSRNPCLQSREKEFIAGHNRDENILGHSWSQQVTIGHSWSQLVTSG